MDYRFMRFPNGKMKAVTFSYDDGEIRDKKLIDIADKHGIRVTLNICSSLVGHTTRLSYDDLKNIISRGHEVASHGKRHGAPGIVSYRDGIADVLDCRRELEQNLGTIIRGYAYPDSGITRMDDFKDYARIKEYMSDLEIAYCRTLAGDNNRFEMPTDWHAWTPTCHFLNEKTFEYAEEFVNTDANKVYISRRHPRLFYLWGHSFEFKTDEDWAKFDEFCALIGEKEDTWYATNIQIHDYTEAYRSLIFSVDNTQVYNPSLFDVWFCVGAETYCVKSGETKIL